MPQVVPWAFGVPSTHVCAPVMHEVTPLRQPGLGLVVQLPPAAHATHVPAAVHTWSCPHVVPAGFSASSTHTGLPVLHSTTPRRHALPGLVVHAAPAWHATHWPVASHTLSVPHAVPAATVIPSLQPGVAPHVVTPRLHGAPGLDAHAAFGTHCRQLPPTHTRSTPHATPDGAGAPSTHVAVPDAHRTTPATHGADGLPLHAAPSSQVMHWPVAVHTRPAPHEVPVGRCLVESTQPAIAPHVVSPSLHGSGLALHAVPAVHVTHSPLRQMRSLPHEVPAAAAGPSMQLGAPPVHSVTPVRHGAPVLPVHGWLA